MKQHCQLFWTTVFICSFVLYDGTFSSPVFVPSIYSGNARNIRHLPCISRKTGETGVCMFAFTCAKANGTHLGTCIDRFYFGSCCKIADKFDSYPHDNVIDLESSVTQSKPFTITTIASTKATSIRTTENNDVPGNVDKFKPSDRPIGVTMTKVTEAIVWNDLKTDPTTESIRLSTFQTVQNATVSRPSPQENLKPLTVPRPKPTLTFVASGAKLPFNGTILPTSTTPFSLVKPSSLSTHSGSGSHLTSKRPILTVSENSLSIFEGTIKPSLNKTTYAGTPTHDTVAFTNSLPVTHETMQIIKSTTPQIIVTTTYKTPTVTRFPPRNVTLMDAAQETNTLKSTTIVNAHVKNVTEIQKQSSTRKPLLSKKPTKITTKKPLLTTANTSSNISLPTLIPLFTTSPVTTVSSASKTSNITITTIGFTNTNNNITTTSKPFTVDNSFKKPLATVKRPLTSVTKNPSLFTTLQVVTLTSKRPSSTILKKNATTSEKPAVMSTFKPTLTTRKETTPATIHHKITTIKSSTTATTSKIEGIKNPTKPASILASDGFSISTTANPSTYTVPSITTNKVHTITKPAPRPANQSSTTVALQSSTHYLINKISSTVLPTSIVSNEIENAISNQTTVIPGIVTWTSFSQNSENSTKTTTSSSITTENHVTEQAATQHTSSSSIYFDTIQTTTVVDVLSTLATITVSPEYTDKPASLFNMSNFKEVCGRRLFPESRIVGGDGSSFAKWPWQISLRQWRTSTYLHKCGAALLNENWAITAAHCVQNVLPSDLLLRIGEHDLGNEEEPYSFQERRVQIVASHPNFDPRTFEFDLALMRFYEPVLPFQPNVLPICIPDDDEDYVGQTAFVTGWGRLYEDGPLPSVLQEVAVPVINNSVCEGMYRNAGYIEHIPHIFICAGWRKGGFDSCEGDSGGPLVIQRKRDKRWVLAGVISWGIGCAEPNQPGVYTRISEFREWINQILQF